MPRTPRKETPKPKRSQKPDNPEQFRRFVEAARKAEMDEDPEAFDRVFDKIVPPKSS